MAELDDTLDEGGWPYLGPEGLVDEDSTLESVALQSGVLVSPDRRVKLHQETFSIARMLGMSAELAEAAWEEQKQLALERLLAANGIKLTYETYTEPAVDALFGRWTLEEILTTEGA